MSPLRLLELRRDCVFLLLLAAMSSSSSDGSACQITDATSPDLSANSVLPVVPLRYMPVPDMDAPIRKSTMTWPAPLSTFLLNRVCELVKDGMEGVKHFKNRDLRAIVQAILEYSGLKVSVNQVYNHLRYWRAKWVQVLRLRMAEGAVWEENTSIVKIEDEAYCAHIKAHPKDAEIINKPIENYAQMKMIYTGRVPAAPVSPAAIHCALNHLMEHKAQGSKYLAMTPAARMAWFTAFIIKYYH